MASLTAIERTLINDAMPINDMYSVGDRIRYLTTGGNFSSGAIAGADLQSFSVGSAQGTAASTGFTDTTGTQMNPYGVYALSTVSSGIHRVSSALTAGNFLLVYNKTTATTGYVVFSTGGGVTVHDTGDCIAKLEPGQSLQCVAISSAKWLIINFTSGSSGGLGETATLSTST